MSFWHFCTINCFCYFFMSHISFTAVCLFSFALAVFFSALANFSLSWRSRSFVFVFCFVFHFFFCYNFTKPHLYLHQHR